MCPAPDTGKTVIPLPAAPTITDLCGVGNAVWNTPPDTTSIDWSLLGDGHLIANAKAGYVFSDNTTTHDFDVAPETNVGPCVTKIAKPTYTVNDPCGVRNAVLVIPSSNTYTITYHYNRSATITANASYMFDDGSISGVKSYTIATPQDSNTLCQSEPIPTPKPTDPCGLDNAYWVKPKDTATVDWSLEGSVLTATAIGVLFQDGRSVISFGAALDSGALCTVKLPHQPSTDDPCGPANALWDVPRDTREYSWSLRDDGHLIVTTTADYVFSNGQTTYDFGVAPDSNSPCPITVVEPTCEADGSITLDLSQPNFGKYRYEVTVNGVTTIYKENSLPVVISVAQGDDVTIKLIRDGILFDIVVLKKHYEFALLNCLEIPVAPAPYDPCGSNNASWKLPEDTHTIQWSIDEGGHLIATAVGTLFTNGESTYDFGTAVDSGVLCAPEPPVVIDCDTVTIPEDTDEIRYEERYTGTSRVVVAIAQGDYYFEVNDGELVKEIVFTLDFSGLDCGKGEFTPPSPTTPAELPRTGNDSPLHWIMALISAATIYGAVYFTQPRRS
jgi:hypothetical protein